MSKSAEPSILWIEPHQHPFPSWVSDLLDYLHGCREGPDLDLVHANRYWRAEFFKFNRGLLFIRHARGLPAHLKYSWSTMVEVRVEPAQAFALRAYQEEPNVVVPPEALDVDIDEAGVLHHKADRVERLQL